MRHPESSVIYLLKNGQAVEAELVDRISERELEDWEIAWRRSMLEIIEDLKAKGVAMSEWPESRNWDWRKKMSRSTGILLERSFTVRCEQMTQGLMTLDLQQRARLAAQRSKELVYVDFLEAAPWNQGQFVTPTFRGVGTALVSAAVALSAEVGFKGRTALHSLPKAEGFYRDKCGFTDCGVDSECGLHYFEFTPEQADKFMQEGSSK